MLKLSELERVIKTALNRGGDFADIFIERKRVTGIVCENDKIEKVNSGLDFGAGVRVFFRGHTAYAYTNDVSLSGLVQAAEVVSRAVQGTTRDYSFDLKQQRPGLEFEIARPPDQVPVEEKVALVKKINSTARDYDSRVKQVTAAYGDAVQEITVANSEGTLISGERIRGRIIASVVVSDGTHIQTGYEAAGSFAGFEFFNEGVSPEDLGQRAAARAVLMLESRPAPAGRMAVVMAGEAGGTMVHEACGHGLEADIVQKELSVYAGKIGEPVASSLVTVVDDATIPNRYGSFPFDDEGTEGQKTVLIEQGKLRTYMYDRLTAFRGGTEPTGNGRRESYQYNPIPRMTNTFIEPGEDSPEDIIKATSRGLYVKKMGGGQVNTTNGDFVFDVSEGYLIENGKITAPVRGATLTGNGPKVLQMIDMVGSDLGWAIGTCGKDGQGVPVGDAQPTIRIPEIVVGGILE